MPGSFYWLCLELFHSDLKLCFILCSTSKWSGCLLWNNCDRRRKREESQHWLWTFQTNQYVIVFVWQQIPHGGKKTSIIHWFSNSQDVSALSDSLKQFLVCMSPWFIEQLALIKMSCCWRHWMSCDWLICRYVWYSLKGVEEQSPPPAIAFL